ncbi:MAG: sulfite exporter TauE/SafE family protein [Anaerolineales bacterium]|nr:sulfite exporter TauE/SafE family protein [Anaerolineales bacterium]
MLIDDPLFYVVAVVAVLIYGISKSGFGSGLGVLGVPLMALVISPGQAAGIMLPVLCVMDIFNVWHYRRTWDRRNLVVLLPAGLLGILIGTFTFHYLSDAHIRILIGLIAVVFVANFYLRRYRKQKPAGFSWWRGSLWGTIAGFTSFGVHAGGPPVNIYLLPQRLDKSLFVGTTVIFFAVVNYVKLIPYYFLDQLNPSNLATSLVLAPLAPLGVWLGLKLHDRVNERLFYNLAYFFLLVTGVKLLYDGVVALF